MSLSLSLDEDAVDCGYCLDDLAHCHGTVVVHLDGRSDCTEFGPPCRLAEEVHEHRIACAQLGCTDC